MKKQKLERKSEKEKFVTPHEYLDKHAPKEARKDPETFFTRYMREVEAGTDSLNLLKVRELLKEAKRRGICAYCGNNTNTSIMNKSDLEEYAISGMCKPCMDATFTEEIMEDKEITKGVIH